MLAVVLLGLGMVLAGCSGDQDTAADTEARSKAEALVAATEKAGVANGLTVDRAEALYGTSASHVCDAIGDGISTAEKLLLTGNPSGRREKLVTSDAVTYGRAVVKTYCPDELKNYEKLVADIDATEKPG